MTVEYIGLDTYLFTFPLEKKSLFDRVREVQEEVGIILNPEKLEDVATVYLEAGGLRYTFYAFRVGLEKAPRIELEPQEHTEAKWLTVEEALELPLIIGGAEILKVYKAKISS